MVNKANSTEFGRWLRARRKKAGLTMSELARAAKMSAAYVHKLENAPTSARDGSPKPSLHTVDVLADALGAPVNEARMVAGYAPVTTHSPLTQRAVALFEALPRDIQAMVLDVLVLIVERLAPESRAFEHESPFPADPTAVYDFGEIDIKSKPVTRRRKINLKV